MRTLGGEAAGAGQLPGGGLSESSPADDDVLPRCPVPGLGERNSSFEVMPGAPGTRVAGRHRWRIVTWIERIVCLLTRVSQTQTQGLGGYEGKEI
jgi:hypothetical protein